MLSRINAFFFSLKHKISKLKRLPDFPGKLMEKKLYWGRALRNIRVTVTNRRIKYFLWLRNKAGITKTKISQTLSNQISFKLIIATLAPRRQWRMPLKYLERIITNDRKNCPSNMILKKHFQTFKNSKHIFK